MTVDLHQTLFVFVSINSNSRITWMSVVIHSIRRLNSVTRDHNFRLLMRNVLKTNFRGNAIRRKQKVHLAARQCAINTPFVAYRNQRSPHVRRPVAYSRGGKAHAERPSLWFAYG